MIEQFTKEQFEAALQQAAAYSGLKFGFGNQDSEYTYRLHLDSNIFIQVRSSVSTSTNMSNGVGKDSIRLYLLHSSPMNTTWISQIDAHTTREPGWEHRLLEKVAQLTNFWHNSGYCMCGRPTVIRRVATKTNKNYGRIYAKCDLYDGHSKEHVYKFLT